MPTNGLPRPPNAQHFWKIGFFRFVRLANFHRYTKNILDTTTLTSTNLPKLSRPLLNNFYFFSHFIHQYLSIYKKNCGTLSLQFHQMSNGYLIVGEVYWRTAFNRVQRRCHQRFGYISITITKELNLNSQKFGQCGLGIFSRICWTLVILINGKFKYRKMVNGTLY